MTDMRIVNYASDRGPRVGVVVGEDIVDAASLTGIEDYASIGIAMRAWAKFPAMIRAALESGRDASRVPLHTTRLHAPIRHGASIFGAGANYYGHSLEMATLAGRPAPADPRTSGQEPWHFLKAPSTVVGDGAQVEYPPTAGDKLDWEVELAVVIGARAKNVRADEALDYVAGFTVANDLSARKLLWREGMHDKSPFRADWVLHKNFDGSTPLGPWLVPAEDFADPQDVALGLSVNGQPMQADRTSDMVFTIAEQIAHLSRHVSLTPGDVILTGTPGGNGEFHGRFLQPGDLVEAWVDGIGTLTTHIV